MAASPIMFKLRVIAPNAKDAPARNKAHIFYIGKRPGVSLNDGMAHGLFGKMQGEEFSEIKSIGKASEYIHEKTIDRTIMYRGVISLKEADALRLGFDKREEWEKLIKQNIFEMADKIGVPASRIEYACAVHMDVGHPHIHFMFWDKEQDVKKPFVHPRISNDIRVSLTKKIYHDEMQELYQLKNEARDGLTAETDSFFKDFFEPFRNMTEQAYRRTMAELRRNPDNALGLLVNNRIPNVMLDDFAAKIFEFREKLPPKGRINYKTLKPELKEELADIVWELIATNEDFYSEFEKYTDVSRALASYYTTDETALDKAKQKAEDDLIKRLSNKLLNAVKETRRSEKDDRQSKNDMRSQALRIFASLFSFLSRENEAQKQKWEDARGELSAQAKKDLAIKEEHASGLDWER